MRLFILEKMRITETDDYPAWLEWMLDPANPREIERTVLENGVTVLTGFLGFCNLLTNDPPMLFETLVFSRDGSPRVFTRKRYPTLAKAKIGHFRSVEANKLLISISKDLKRILR